ncbi:hypothetical protein Q3G72_002588 [Acer saccharum]|nr:hypothetical protein Q3G72_002588 [Acer saccharum]
MKPSEKYFLQLVILVLLLITTACEAFSLLDPKVHLSIENNMGSGVDLTVHFFGYRALLTDEPPSTEAPAPAPAAAEPMSQ